jgi:hypothetical protein
MFSIRFRRNHRQARRSARDDVVDRRSGGSPAGRRPDPMPRVRWHV